MRRLGSCAILPGMDERNPPGADTEVVAVTVTEPRRYSVRDAAAVLGISPRAVRKRIEVGDLAAERTGWA